MFKYFTHTNTKSTVGLLILFTSVVFTTVIAGDTWEYINPNGTGSVFQHVQNDEKTGSATAHIGKGIQEGWGWLIPRRTMVDTYAGIGSDEWDDDLTKATGTYTLDVSGYLDIEVDSFLDIFAPLEEAGPVTDDFRGSTSESLSGIEIHEMTSQDTTAQGTGSADATLDCDDDSDANASISF